MALLCVLEWKKRPKTELNAVNQQKLALLMKQFVENYVFSHAGQESTYI